MAHMADPLEIRSRELTVGERNLVGRRLGDSEYGVLVPTRVFEPSLSAWLRAAAPLVASGDLSVGRREQLADALRQAADLLAAR